MNQTQTTARCPVTGEEGARPVDPGPRGWPIIGYALQYMKDPLIASLRIQRDHGEVSWLRLPRRTAIQVTSPVAAKRILQSNHMNYRRGLWFIGLREWMGMGLITLDGEEWRTHRKVVQPAFTSEGRSRQFEHVLYGIDKQIERWEELASDATPTDLLQEMNELVSRALSKSLMNRDLDRELVRAVAFVSTSIWNKTVGRELPRFLPTRYNRRKRWAHRKLDAVADEVAAARADGDERDDVAGLLLRSGLGKNAFRQNLRTFLLAGSDSTATGIAWAMWELAVHPEIRHRVEQEVDDVLGERVPSEEDVSKLPMCRAVVHETLRLHPPVWITARDANDADVIDGCPIKAGERVVIPIFAMHRSPRHWPDPEAFDPQRFLEDPEQVRRNDAYMPFGAGKHLCIGRELALTTMVLSVAMLSRRFRVTPDGAEQVRQKAYTTLKPDPGMPVTIHERPRDPARSDPAIGRSEIELLVARPASA